MEQSMERAHASVARNQNVIAFAPHGAGALAGALGAPIERVAHEDGAVRVLVITADPDTAVLAADTALRLAPAGALRPLAATAPARAARLLRAVAPTVVAGTPAVLLELIRGAALKLDGVRAVVLAWPDAILAAGMTDALEAVMAEIPKEAARTLVASRATPEVDALADRYAWRARRADTEAGAAAEDALALRYVVCSPAARPAVLRRVLDERDPELGAVYAREEASAAEAASTLHALGYLDAGAPVVLTRDEAPEGASLVVLYDLPLSGPALRALHPAGADVLVLVSPAQLPALHALVGEGRAQPMTLPEPLARARTREERARDELRAVLAGGVPARELLALEPLLAEYDGSELAAAALHLLADARRAASKAAAAPAPAPAATAPAAATTRIFISAGARDRVAPRDLVGAIANEAGVPGDRIGRVDVRESHSVVEVPSEMAAQVVARLTGASLRGRRLIARIDAERPRAPRGEGERGARPRGEGERGARPRGPRGPRPSRPPRSRDE